MRVPPSQLQTLPLEAHAVLSDMMLHDASAIDLPGGGAGRTLDDVRSLPTQEKPASSSRLRAAWLERYA